MTFFLLFSWFVGKVLYPHCTNSSGSLFLKIVLSLCVAYIHIKTTWKFAQLFHCCGNWIVVLIVSIECVVNAWLFQDYVKMLGQYPITKVIFFSSTATLLPHRWYFRWLTDLCYSLDSAVIIRMISHGPLQQNTDLIHTSLWQKLF